MGSIERSASRRSLAELYERHAGDAVGLAYLLTGERALAEDLVQEAFARIARRFVHIRHPEAFEAYLSRAVVNLANSQFRRRAIERRRLPGQFVRPETQEPDAGTALTLRRAILGLPVRQRTALVLRFYEDLSERESAAVMGCRVGAVRQLVYRAMQTLRQELSEEEEP